MTAAALDLDGQDAVHDVNEPAIAGLVANPSGLHPESSHHDNAAASSAHDVFRAENDLDSKLADFRPQQGDGFPIAASEQVERTVTHNPVSSSAPSNPTPDHPAPQHVSTAPTTAIAHSDTTITPDNLSSASHVEDTIHPLILNVTSLSDAIQAPVSDLQPEVTSTGEPAAQVDHGHARPTSRLPHPDATIAPVTSTGEPAAQHDSTAPTTAIAHSDTTIAPVTSTGEPAAQHDSTAPTTAIAHSDTTIAPVTSTGEPAAQVNYSRSAGDVTATDRRPTSRSSRVSNPDPLCRVM